MTSHLKISVTELGEYIRYESCQRRFKLTLLQDEIPDQIPFAPRVFSVLDIALQEMGKRREQEWENSLLAKGFVCLNPQTSASPDERRISWQDFLQRLHTVPSGQCAFAREVEVAGELGRFAVEGRIDFALLLWPQGRPQLRFVESKASRKDQVHHRVQICL